MIRCFLQLYFTFVWLVCGRTAAFFWSLLHDSVSQLALFDWLLLLLLFSIRWILQTTARESRVIVLAILTPHRFSSYSLSTTSHVVIGLCAERAYLNYRLCPTCGCGATGIPSWTSALFRCPILSPQVLACFFLTFFAAGIKW